MSPFLIGDTVRFRTSPEVAATLGRDITTEEKIVEVRAYPCDAGWYGYTLESGRRAVGVCLEHVKRKC